jgi:hypothetical protein
MTNDDELVRIARYLEQEHKDKKELEKESLKGTCLVLLVCLIFACIFAFVIVNWIESL